MVPDKCSVGSRTKHWPARRDKSLTGATEVDPSGGEDANATAKHFTALPSLHWHPVSFTAVVAQWKDVEFANLERFNDTEDDLMNLMVHKKQDMFTDYFHVK